MVPISATRVDLLVNRDSFPPYGLLRIAAVSPEVSVGDPAANTRHIRQAVAASAGADIVLLPELGLTGYTCGDLFGQQALLQAAQQGLMQLAVETRQTDQLVVVGLPLAVGPSLMNVAAALWDGQVIAVVPKQYLPTYKEFYEGRWFRAGDGSEPATVQLAGHQVPLGIDLLIRMGDAVLGIEICEDLWSPVPPSSFQALAGANVLLNLSSSNEQVGKPAWRRDLIVSQSGRCIAAYAYAGSGPSESTTDLVFGGHCLIAENGQVLGQSRRIGDGGLPWKGMTSVVADVDVERLQHDRRVIGSFDDARGLLPRTYRIIDLNLAAPSLDRRQRPPAQAVAAHPFVPSDNDQLEARCAEIFGIQTAGLAKRVSRLPQQAPLVIGVSGGLDSTLALLVAVKACDAYDWPRSRILAITMPGFGTTDQTLDNARALMDAMQVSTEQIDIRPLCLQAFRSLEHRPLGVELTETMDVRTLQQQLGAADHAVGDLVLENVQARLRTLLLMSRGFVLGTGDLSEQALGWSTYNGDHMSMYNVNTSVPKTLVRFLVRYAADHHFPPAVQGLLHQIADTPISPELLPPSADGQIQQQTEETLGPYELHDFFLFHVVRNGFSPEKVLYLARHARFTRRYGDDQVRSTLATFYRRFFANQFKRSCVPDGPKVGTVSLSPRGDWRMPSDADQGPLQA